MTDAVPDFDSGSVVYRAIRHVAEADAAREAGVDADPRPPAELIDELRAEITELSADAAAGADALWRRKVELAVVEGLTEPRFLQRGTNRGLPSLLWLPGGDAGPDTTFLAAAWNDDGMDIWRPPAERVFEGLESMGNVTVAMRARAAYARLDAEWDVPPGGAPFDAAEEPYGGTDEPPDVDDWDGSSGAPASAYDDLDDIEFDIAETAGRGPRSGRLRGRAGRPYLRKGVLVPAVVLVALGGIGASAVASSSGAPPATGISASGHASGHPNSTAGTIYRNGGPSSSPGSPPPPNPYGSTTQQQAMAGVVAELPAYPRTLSGAGFASASLLGGLEVEHLIQWGNQGVVGNVPPGSQSGFTITKSNATQTSGKPVSYWVNERGCDWGSCSVASGSMPLPASEIAKGNVAVLENKAIAPGGGVWLLADDVVFTPAIHPTDTGLEMMIWLAQSGGIKPQGSMVAQNIQLGARHYDVWSRPGHLDFVLSTPDPSATIDIGPLTQYALAHNYMTAQDKMVDAGIGFLVWSGGVGGQVQSFSAHELGSPG